MGQVAGSLTFTTLLALVPLLAMVLAVFSAFPVFSAFEAGLQQYFLQSLVPESIGGPVLRLVNQFASKAARLGLVGFLGVAVAAVALLLTMDRALNRIWRVRRPRPLAYRLMVYASALIAGPLAVSVSFTLATAAYGAAQGWGPVVPALMRVLLTLLEGLALMSGAVALYRWLPNTQVRWRDACLGGAFVVLAFHAAKALLAWYVSSVSTFATVYGAFATLPILLLWIYIVWCIVLSGALLAAVAPTLGTRPGVDLRAAGARFTVALEVLRVLAERRDGPEPTVDVLALARTLQVDALQLRGMVEEMCQWGWVAWSDGAGPSPAGVYLRLHPAQCPMRIAVAQWLLAPHAANRAWSQVTGLDSLSLADLL